MDVHVQAALLVWPCVTLINELCFCVFAHSRVRRKLPMRTVIVGVLTALLAAPAGVYAEAAGSTAGPPPAQSVQGRPGALQASAIAQVKRMVRNETLQTPATGQPTAQESWPKRHPVIVGALAGAGVGAVIMGTMCSPDSNCDGTRGAFAAFGAGLFAPVGALAGWLISKAQ